MRSRRYTRCPKPQVVSATERPASLACLCTLGGLRLLKRGDVVNRVFVDVPPHFAAPSDARVVCDAEELARGECGEELETGSIR